jgi:hypothetical protein
MNIKTTSLSKRIKDIGGSTTEEWRVGHMEWDKVEGQPQNKRKRCRPQLEGDPTTTNKQSMEGQKKKKNRRAGYSIIGQVENHARATSLASFQLNQSSRNMVVVSGLKLTLSRAASVG